MSDDSKPGPRIKIVKDGPYLVTGSVPLDEQRISYGPDGEPDRWVQGPAYPEQESYSLCRCGASKDKPFCDGSHVEAGFDGTETAGHGSCLAGTERTVGPGVDLTWSPKLCMGIGFCHAGRDAWHYAVASAEPEARAKAVEEAGNCPSGALVAWDKGTGQAVEPAFAPSVSLVEDSQRGLSGPIWVKGGVPIESADGREYDRCNRVTLCRCGLSKNKPFCDGAHAEAGFKSRP